MVITLDGPTASGKSTLAAHLAHKLGWYHINSGFLYRAIAHLAVREQYDLSDERMLTSYAHDLLSDPSFMYTYTARDGVHISYKNEDITPFLKTSTTDVYASQISKYEGVRSAVTAYQRKLGQEHNCVVDGRDCGTVVFPDAEVKFFVTASLEVRAQRWCLDQAAKGRHYSSEECQFLVNERDERDKTRTVSPLRMPEGAHVLDTTHTDPQEVVNQALVYIKEKYSCFS